MSKEKWNERYREDAYAYGTEPNDFLKATLSQFPAGKILFPAEGEGRNAVFAALEDWEVDAFDQSSAGKDKALKLAESSSVQINYTVGDLHEIMLKPEYYDAIALIYAHFPAEIKSQYHKEIQKSLKPGGIVIFEAFSKKHLEHRKANPAVGGPDNEAMLFDENELKHDFEGFDILLLKEEVINLSEGVYHNGEGSVMRFIGRKK